MKGLRLLPAALLLGACHGAVAAEHRSGRLEGFRMPAAPTRAQGAGVASADFASGRGLPVAGDSAAGILATGGALSGREAVPSDGVQALPARGLEDCGGPRSSSAQSCVLRVPEPKSWAMLLLGAGCIVYQVRRGRRARSLSFSHPRLRRATLKSDVPAAVPIAEHSMEFLAGPIRPIQN